MKRYTRWGRMGALGALAAAVACDTWTAADLGRVVVTDPNDPSGRTYETDRDVGLSTRLSGTKIDADSGSPVQVDRALWVFGDTLVFDASGQPLSGLWATNTASITPVSPTGAPPLAMPASIEPPGSFFAIKPLVAPNRYPSCDSLHYAAKWPSAVVTLPDSDPATETVLLFYQNFCVRPATSDYVFGDVGVAVLQWRASDPDALPTVQSVEDHLFPPSAALDRVSGTVSVGYGYATGAVVGQGKDGGTYVYAYLCPSDSDCSVARAPLDATLSGLDEAQRTIQASAWTYLSGGAWQPFPIGATAQAGPGIVCSPSATSTCARAPLADAVTKADPNTPSTLPSAGAQVAAVGGGFVMTYTSLVFAGTNAASWRYSPYPEGPWSDPSVVGLPTSAPDDPTAPAGLCGSGQRCRVPFIHPEFSDASAHRYRFTYYASDDARGRGSLRWGEVCADANYKPQSCSR